MSNTSLSSVNVTPTVLARDSGSSGSGAAARAQSISLVRPIRLVQSETGRRQRAELDNVGGARRDLAQGAMLQQQQQPMRTNYDEDAPMRRLSHDLRGWLNYNHFFQPGCTKGRAYTHLLMSGGSALVADDQYDMFLQNYADDLSNGRRWAIHECATRNSRLYFDFDISESHFDEDKQISLEQIESWVQVVQHVVLRFFPSAVGIQRAGRVIVLGAPIAVVENKKRAEQTVAQQRRSKTRTSSDVYNLALVEQVRTGERLTQSHVLSAIKEREVPRQLRKTGLHIVFPDLLADLNEMLHIRAACVAALGEKFSPPGDHPWSKIIDEQVYTHSAGLRMPGSVKVEPCALCKNGEQKRKTCVECNGHGREWINRPYMPVLVLGGNGRRQPKFLDALKRTMREMVRWCTIRQPQALPPHEYEFVMPPDVRRWAGPFVEYQVEKPNASHTSWAAAMRRGAGGSSGAAIASKKNADPRALHEQQQLQRVGPKSSQLTIFGPDEEISRLIERFIRRYTYPQWKQVQVYEVRMFRCSPRSATTASSGGRSGGGGGGRGGARQVVVYVAKVHGDGARYCLNMGGEHNSAHVYFHISRHGVEQRCFCRCDTTAGRRTGVPCKDFRSDQSELLQYDFGQRLFMRLFPDEADALGMLRHDMLGVGGAAGAGTLQSVVDVNFDRHVDSAYPTLAELEERAAQVQSVAAARAEDPLLTPTDGSTGASDDLFGYDALTLSRKRSIGAPSSRGGDAEDLIMTPQSKRARTTAPTTSLDAQTGAAVMASHDGSEERLAGCDAEDEVRRERARLEAIAERARQHAREQVRSGLARPEDTATGLKPTEPIGLSLSRAIALSHKGGRFVNPMTELQPSKEARKDDHTVVRLPQYGPPRNVDQYVDRLCSLDEELREVSKRQIDA